MTIAEEIEAIRRRADEGYATSDIDLIGEALTDLLDLLARVVSSRVELKIIDVVDIKEGIE